MIETYSYDANGAMISGAAKTTAWSSFNKPQIITDSLTGNESLFVYGASRARVKHRETDSGLVTNLVYVGSHFDRKARLGEDDELVHYIRAGGATVAIYTEYRDDLDALTGSKTRYLHRDHLGSIESITDETGQVSERFSYAGRATGHPRSPASPDRRRREASPATSTSMPSASST